MYAQQYNQPQQRLLSLDVMRGLIMILLAAESCMLYESLYQLQPTGAAGLLVAQFFHHPWHGLRFWDLVQPSFMTIAGAALYISYYNKTQKGITWQHNFKHIAIRSIKLFICGTALHCIYAGKLVWELWNVLTQLSFTTIIAYIIIRKPVVFQIVISVMLLVITEVLYRFVLMPGFNQPFVTGHNFGNWMDTVMMNKINTDGWVAINIIPTAAHTIWGVLAGRLLISHKTGVKKIRLLIIAAAICLVLGLGLDILNITPIIKRISTSSFVLASAGWVLLIIVLLYWLVDIKHWNKLAWIFGVVGANAIFIYLFFETAGHQFLNGIIGIFVKGFIGYTGTTQKWLNIFAALATLFAEWYLCYWLNNKKIFFKL
jgi:predicted acyltransferase